MFSKKRGIIHDKKRGENNGKRGDDDKDVYL